MSGDQIHDLLAALILMAPVFLIILGYIVLKARGKW